MSINDQQSTSIKLLVYASLIYICSLIAYKLRFNTLAIPENYLLVTTIFALFSVLFLSLSDHTHISLHSSPLKRINNTLTSLFLATLTTTLILYFLKSGHDFSRIWLAITVIGSLTTILLFQYILIYAFSVSSNDSHIIVIGEYKQARKLNDMLNEFNDQQIKIIKSFVCDAKNSQTNDLIQLIVDASNFIESYRKKNSQISVISEAWIMSGIFSKVRSHEIETILSTCAINVVYVPETPTLSRRFNIETHNGVPIINSNFQRSQSLNRLIKFFEDKLLASIIIVLCLPLIILTAIAIKLDSPGPVLFKQKRYGLNGKQFFIYKFRTMKINESDEEFKQATLGDPRVTRLGSILRKSSVDELPQLWNVLNGTMSIVGPRPHPNKLNESHVNTITSYMKRHNVKPGITGLAQSKGYRGETNQETMQKRIEYDLQYAETWSLLLDIKILLKTLVIIVLGDNAY